ncbi:MAG: cytochrome c family protein [Thiotrichaceae bacterium]
MTFRKSHLLLIPFIALFLNNVSFAADAHKDITNVSSKKCEKCHEEIYDQWKGSMHAQSTALKDPIHGTFYSMVIGDPRKEGVKKNGKYPACLQCHSPAAAKAGKTKLDAKKSYSEGVNCISCHTLTKFKGTKKEGGGLQLGMKAYEYSTSKLQGPSGTSEKHKKWGKGVEGNPGLMKTSAACMGCHDQRPNANKVSLCQTGDEIATAGGSTTCQTCHMPTTEDGITNHAMMGGHQGEMVSRGLVMTVDAKKEADTTKATVKLQNLLPHSFPTGAPFRNFYVMVAAFNKEGTQIWTSTKSHPMKDDKQAMFMYTIGNEDGPTAPPMATKVIADTRLKPNETREISYEIPGDVARVNATAYYDLLLNPIKKKFGDKLPAELLEPKEIAKAQIRL